MTRTAVPSSRVSAGPEVSRRLPAAGLNGSIWFGPVASVTAVLALAAGVFADPDPRVSVAVVTVVVLFLGIPHGAVDHLVDRATYGRPVATVRQRVDLRFHLWYVAAIVATLAVWTIAPPIALAAFLASSVHHFGQSDLAWCRLSPLRQVALQWSRGVLLVGLPLVAHLDRVAPTIERLGGGRPDEWGWLGGHATTWCAILVIQHMAVGAWTAYGARLAVGSLRREVVGVGILVALFLLADPLVGFAIYFGLWHSLGHVLVLRQTLAVSLGSPTTPMGWRRFARLALLRTMLSAVGIGIVVVGTVATGRIEDAAAALFVLVSAITVPHLVVVERLWRISDG